MLSDRGRTAGERGKGAAGNGAPPSDIVLLVMFGVILTALLAFRIQAIRWRTTE